MPENQLELVIDAKATLGEDHVGTMISSCFIGWILWGNVHIYNPKLETTGPFM